MATIGTVFAAEQSPPILDQPNFALGPEANATPTQDPFLSDVVTLTGRTAENRKTRAGNDDAELAETASFFFAERQSFRAANGSGGQTSHAPNVPELPVKLSASERAGQRGIANGVDSSQNPPPLAANAPEQNEAENAAANIQANNAIDAASQPGANTPLAELAQLDRTLQQIGIDPRSISLFNRMAMLLYANDPAALKMLVQTLESGAQQMATDPNGEAVTANRYQAGPGMQNASSPQTWIPDGQPSINQIGIGSVAQSSLVARLAFDPQEGSFSEAPQEQPARLPSVTEPAGSAKAGAELNAPLHLASLSAQLSDLSLTFTAIGAPQLAFDSQNAQLGRFLNVTF